MPEDTRHEAEAAMKDLLIETARGGWRDDVASQEHGVAREVVPTITHVSREQAMLLKARIGDIGDKDSSAARGWLTAVLNAQASVGALGPALAAAKPETSPQMARSLQAAENRWRRMEEEFGLYSSLDVADLLVGSSNRTLASHYRSDGKILGVKRGRSYRYPGFQFDLQARKIWEVIPKLIRVAHENAWSDESLALWMCTGTGYLDDDRPVDRLNEPDTVLEVAARKFGEEW